MAPSKDQIFQQFPALRRPVLLTFAGLWAERLLQAFWPALSLVAAVAAAGLLGLFGVIPPMAQYWALVALGLSGLALLALGARRLVPPKLAEALARVDARLAGRPIAAVTDHLALGRDDPAARALWQAHLQRMARRLDGARAIGPRPRLAAADPLALRLMAATALCVALIFGGIDRLAGVAPDPGGAGEAMATGPAWEGWVEPPAYTGKPPLYLADLGEGPIALPRGSRVTLRLYGAPDELRVEETISGQDGPQAPEGPTRSFELSQDGELRIIGPSERSWRFRALADALPRIQPEGVLQARLSGEWRQPFVAADDYGVQTGFARIELDLASVDRRHGLAAEPEPRPAIELDLPLPFTGDRREIEGILEEALAQHPWAGLPVRLTLGVRDAAQQVGLSEPEPMILPARRFFDPLAAALIEQRRDLLWTRANAGRISQILRAVSYQPGDDFRRRTDILRVKRIIRRLELLSREGALTQKAQEDLAAALWALALSIEEGNLADAAERLRQAQDRLEQAMREGASEDEIQQLMDELREALRDYMRQLAEQAPQNPDQPQNGDQQMQEMTSEQLDQLLDRLQELMEQGRMAEAQQLLEMLQQLMENMQVQQGQQGEQGQGQQALEGLADTLRQQQGLSDDTFSDLQDEAQPGQEGQQGQEGQDGQQGQGQQGQQGDMPGQQGEGEGETGPGGRSPGQEGPRGLADRQQALRDMLNQQMQNLPGQAGPGARQSLEDAGRAMDGAEDALREGDLPGALEDQAQAMESLREGMRELSQDMARQQQQGQQGQAFGEANTPNRTDPLGRESSEGGQVGTDEQLLQGPDVYRRAEELLDELRRRSGERQRSQKELDYLDRLLRQF